MEILEAYDLTGSLLRVIVHGRQRLALEHRQVFVPYLNMGVRFQDHLTRARLEPAGVQLLRFDDYFPRLLGLALAADWGKRPLPHPRSTDARSDQHAAPSPPPESQPGAFPSPLGEVRVVGDDLGEGGPAARHGDVGQHRRCAWAAKSPLPSLRSINTLCEVAWKSR
jgi:hypothetical protein